MGSLALIARLAACPTVLVCAAGVVIVGGLLAPPARSSRSWPLAVPPRPSLTVTVTLLAPAVVGVPLMRPLLALMLSPAGSPLAL